jgi:hypothetical protein
MPGLDDLDGKLVKMAQDRSKNRGGARDEWA